MAGPSSSIDVFLRLHGQRKFAKEVAASGAELEAMGLKGAKSMAAFAKSADKLKKFGKSWTHNVSLPIAGLSVIAGGMAVNFKRQMGLVATDAGGATKEVAHLEKSVLGLSRESQFGPQQLAESLFHVESSGYRGAKAMKVLNESQKLATTGNSELQSTTYALVSATKALYGESLTNVNRTAAELNGIVAHGDMRLEELTSAMATGVIPKAKAVGLNLRDVGAAMDVMTARGIPAQRAAYALGFTMQKLIPATEKAEDAFTSIGLGQETLINASKNGKYGYVTGLEVLQKHLDGLSKPQQTKKIEEMFGGGRMTSGLLTDLQNLGEMKKIYIELGNEVGKYAQHTKDAENQPLVKLKESWSDIQASLVEIGNDLIPLAGPAIEKFAKVATTLTHDFLALPGPVKAATVGFLLLTGPVASGLGYFASGVGRALILTKKLAYAGKDVSAFSWAMGQGMGSSGAAKYAFRGSGISAAAETAKGFAYSLGPAVAAYGIGNIVTSATSGDWKDAGFEAGGAVAGGIAGFMLGGPMAAMLGVGLGSLGGELLSGLFGSDKKLSPLQKGVARSTEQVTAQFKHLEQAGHGLVASEGRIKTSRLRMKSATSAMRIAQGHYNAVLQEYGPHSRAALRSESRLTLKVNAHRRAVEKLRNANRLSGLSLSTYKTVAERTESVLRRQIRGLGVQADRQGKAYLAQKRLNPQSKKTAELAQAFQKITTALMEAEQKQAQLRQSALSKGGPQLLRFLRKASTESLEFGHSLNQATNEIARLGEASAKFSGVGAGGFIKINPRGEVEKVNAGGEPLHPLHQHHRAGGKGGRPPKGASRRNFMNIPQRRSAQPLVSGDGERLFRLEVHVRNENTLKVDGKELARNVTGHAQRDASRR